jgi:hypothetical protein
MFATCLFCRADLGRNDAVEHFPVGRRLAYDAAKGRLWVVCRRCERWNLTPLEERWEAIEDAERLFRGTRLRRSTDQVGLARVADGTELVRVGAPLRPELAAWRYGDQFGRRRRRHVLVTAGVGTAAVAAVVAGPALGLFSFAALSALDPLIQAASFGAEAWQKNRGRVRLVVPGAGACTLSDKRLRKVRVGSGPDGSFRVEIDGWAPVPDSSPAWASHALVGDAAVRAAGQMLPALNRAGAGRGDVAAAVALLEEGGDPAGLARLLQRVAPQHFRPGPDGARAAPMGKLSAVFRLALEMAAHEEQERRAMDGELAELERAWREAEEVAAIADDLLLPAAVGERLDQLKGRSTARAGAASSPPSDSGSATSS